MDLAERDTYGQDVILALIKKSICDGGFGSEAELSRGLNIVPQKLNRWKNGKSAVSTEGVTLARILLKLPSGRQIKELLDRQGHDREMEKKLDALIDKARSRSRSDDVYGGVLEGLLVAKINLVNAQCQDSISVDPEISRLLDLKNNHSN